MENDSNDTKTIEKKSNENYSLTTTDLVNWMWQITRGMNYLSSKKIIHRDLATRNVLVQNIKTVKVCDFGLAREIEKSNIYQQKSTGPVPTKWLALESLVNKIYTTDSDIWSFGICMWEIVNFGITPYPNFENGQIQEKLQSGYRLEKPLNTNNELYNIMLSCWNEEPTLRPSFLLLGKNLGNLFGDEIKSVSSLFTKM